MNVPSVANCKNCGRNLTYNQIVLHPAFCKEKGDRVVIIPIKEMDGDE